MGAGLVGEASEADLAVVAVPSGAVREVACHLPPGDPLLVVASKGLEAATGRFMADVLLDARPEARVGVLSGPNLAMEIARQVPTVALAAFARREGRRARPGGVHERRLPRVPSPTT